MNIDERIALEEDRHYQKIKQLNDILRMYENSVRENSAYIDRNVNQAAMSGINPDRIVSYEESRQISNPYAKQIEETIESIKQENELFEKRMAILSQQKEEIEKQNRESEIAREREKQQREIELIELQQQINKIENERLEIEKRLRTIAMDTLGSYFSRQISERYPDEYQRYQQNKEQVRKRLNNVSQISDLKEKFSKVSEDLQFYKSVLPIYENYYQRYEEVKREREQQRAAEKEKKNIYNLVHSEENDRLNTHRSLYTAYDLGGKNIPAEYQGMTYEQVDASLKQKQAEEKTKREAQLTRDELIGKAIRKSIMVPEDYHLSDVQIKNLSAEFINYSNEDLQHYIAGGKKKETISSVSPEIMQQPSIMTNPISINQTQASDDNDYESDLNSFRESERNLISFIESKYPNMGKAVEIISVSGYPDSNYEVRFEDGNIHQVTVTQEEQKKIRNQIPEQEEVNSTGGMRR